MLRRELGRICNAPFEEQAPKTKEDFELKAVRSHARALLKDKDNKIPDDRRKELTQTLLEYFKKEVLTEDDIETAADLDPRYDNDDYVSHAENVVKHYSENDGILRLEKLWREHFLKTMKPKFLPPNWSVDHQENRLTIRKEENRIDEQDLELAHGKQ